MIRSRTEATQSNSTSKIIQVNNHCLIITNSNTNYSHVMLVVLVDLYQVLILVKIRGYADGQAAFFTKQRYPSTSLHYRLIMDLQLVVVTIEDLCDEYHDQVGLS